MNSYGHTLFYKGSVSDTGPGDPGSRGLAMPDPKTFPCALFHVYNW